MSKFLATILLVGGLVAAAAATPAGAHWLADTGALAGDTGSDSSDTGGASHDTGSEGGDTGDTGNDTEVNDTEVSDSDTGDTGTDDTGSNEESTPVYSAAELANDKGGCSTTSGSQGPWVWALLGLMLGRQRRRFI